MTNLGYLHTGCKQTIIIKHNLTNLLYKIFFPHAMVIIHKYPQVKKETWNTTTNDGKVSETRGKTTRNTKTSSVERELSWENLFGCFRRHSNCISASSAFPLDQGSALYIFPLFYVFYVFLLGLSVKFSVGKCGDVYWTLKNKVKFILS